jgi:uncharacterized damage-inducible protein DinB
MKRPDKTEYAAYYETYVSLVNEIDIFSTMKTQNDEIHAIFSQMSDEQGLYAYAEDKWTIKELLGHLIDSEQIFAYRALRIGRGDATPLPGFDQDPYVENGNFNEAKLADLLSEFSFLRQANVIMFNNFKFSNWDNAGIASENKVTTRAIAYIMVGHIRHHINILKEKYLA